MTLPETSPIQDLPVELLAEIFQACLPYEAFPPRASAELAPLLLCSVCAGWRRFVCSRPEMWTDIYLSVERDYSLYDEELDETLNKRIMEAKVLQNVQSVGISLKTRVR